MKKLACSTVFIGLILGTVGPAWGAGISLSGTKFAVTVEYLYVADIGLPFTAGETFENCYTFNNDLTQGNALASGIWDDPLFPNPGPPIPGTWIQHNRGKTNPYTALAEDGAGVSLVQNGTVTPAFGKKPVRLRAYTVISVVGLGPIIELVSKGHQVDECPSGQP